MFVAVVGAALACLILSPPALAAPWPGSASVTTVDQTGVLGADVSGLDYEGSGSAAPGVMWAVDNGNFLMHRLVWDGAQWVRDTANGWSAGKTLRYPTGLGNPDVEGVTLTDAGAAGGVYVSTERDTTASSVSRISVLRYDVSGAGKPLTATHEWNLTPDLPAVGSNAGAESVEWVPDTYLVEHGFVDEATAAPYNPATYANHGTGLFFVGLEGNGIVYAYALDQTSSSFTRVATFASGFSTFGALHFDPETEQLWVVCDNNCLGASRVFEIDTAAGPTQGKFVAVADYDRPAGMANLNNEGFTITPNSECVEGSKPVYWADDGNTDSHVLRRGTINCPPPPEPAGGPDFNGDGFADLTVGVPDEDVGTAANAGAVNVLYGSASGVVGAASQLWHQNSASISDSAEADDHFGAAIATGDFNADGFDDLAVGAPDEDVGAIADAGVVHVLYGSAFGLSGTGSQYYNQASAGILDGLEAGDRFGASLAAGDLDGSGYADLAVGAPGESVGAVAQAGVAQVVLGSAGGLASAGNQLWSQNSTGISDSSETGDGFGAAVAVGDFSGDGLADLAIGTPDEDVGAIGDGGVVHVLLGSASGPTATGSQYWNQNSSGVIDTIEAGDRFGAALATGDFNGDALADLAVGAPAEDAGAVADAGAVNVLLGDATGLRPRATCSSTRTPLA